VRPGSSRGCTTYDLNAANTVARQIWPEPARREHRVEASDRRLGAGAAGILVETLAEPRSVGIVSMSDLGGSGLLLSASPDRLGLLGLDPGRNRSAGTRMSGPGQCWAAAFEAGRQAATVDDQVVNLEWKAVARFFKISTSNC